MHLQCLTKYGRINFAEVPDKASERILFWIAMLSRSLQVIKCYCVYLEPWKQSHFQAVLRLVMEVAI